jgi:hypothetical protein
MLALGIGLDFSIEGLGLTVLDVIGIAGVVVMGTMLFGRALLNLRELAAEEPSAASLARLGYLSLGWKSSEQELMQ